MRPSPYSMQQTAKHLILALFATSAACAKPADTPHTERPNIVFIMADDIGIGDLSHYQKLHNDGKVYVATPTLDRLIDGGMRFEQAHSSTALCSPTRYCVISGNYSHRSYDEWGVWASFNTSPFTNGNTVATAMKEAGYQTGFIGKWHLGGDFYQADSKEIYTQNIYGTDGLFDPRQLAGGHPHALGFDYSLCLPAGIQNIPYAVYENSQWLPLANDSTLRPLTWKDVPKGTELGKKAGMGDSHWDASQIGPLIANKACDFIEKSAPGAPYFLVYFTQAVHHPHNPPATFNRTPVNGTTTNGSTPHLDMIYELDLQISAILEAVEASGEAENTLIVFTSDNGGMLKQVPSTQKSGHDPTMGLRGEKGDIWEGGHRVPFIAYWPGKIAANTVASEPVLAHDIVATASALAGTTPAAGIGLDSLNLLPTFFGKSNPAARDEYTITGQSNGLFHLAYYKGPWKLVLQAQTRPGAGRYMSRDDWLKRAEAWRPCNFTPISLFNIEKNPSEDEAHNLLNDPSYTQTVAELKAAYLAHRNQPRTTPALR